MQADRRPDVLRAVGNDLDPLAVLVGQTGRIDVPLRAAEIVAAPGMIVQAVRAIARRGRLRNVGMGDRFADRAADMVVRIVAVSPRCGPTSVCRSPAAARNRSPISRTQSSGPL